MEPSFLIIIHVALLMRRLRKTNSLQDILMTSQRGGRMRQYQLLSGLRMEKMYIVHETLI